PSSEKSNSSSPKSSPAAVSEEEPVLSSKTSSEPLVSASISSSRDGSVCEEVHPARDAKRTLINRKEMSLLRELKCIILDTPLYLFKFYSIDLRTQPKVDINGGDEGPLSRR